MIEESEKKRGIKIYLAVFALLILLAGSVYGYFRYRSFIKLQESAKAVIEENEELRQEVKEYEELKQTIVRENDRCEKILLQEEGNFAEFSYCQRFLEFAETIDVDLQ